MDEEKIVIPIEDVFTSKLVFRKKSVTILIPCTQRDRHNLLNAREVTIGIIKRVEWNIGCILLKLKIPNIFYRIDF